MGKTAIIGFRSPEAPLGPAMQMHLPPEFIDLLGEDSAREGSI